MTARELLFPELRHLSMTRYGNISGAIESIRDVTERREAADFIRQAEEKYRNIFENAVEGIFQSTPAVFDGSFKREN
jgi:PAS domain-containing protein